jgi:flagellin
VGSEYHAILDSLKARNPVHIIRIHLEDMNALTVGEGSLDLRNAEEPELTLCIDSKESAQKAIDRLESAMDKVNGYRADLGALQNRLTSTINNLSIQLENFETTKSRIKDADYAEESSRMVQMKILQQAGVSILSQANQMPELALKLLG